MNKWIVVIFVSVILAMTYLAEGKESCNLKL